MKINYEGYAEANGRRYPIKVQANNGLFYIEPVPGQDSALTGKTPEEVKEKLPAWLEAAEGELEYQREQRREYAEEKKQRAAKVVNTEAWLIFRDRSRKIENEKEVLDSIRAIKVTVRGKKARSRSYEALITMNGTNTSRPVNDLKLGTAEDMEEYKALSLASWKAEKAAKEAKEEWAYRKFYGTGFASPDPDFQKRVQAAVATYNGDGTWTISAEGIEDFVVSQDEFHRVESMVERRMAAVKHPFTMTDKDRRGYKSDEQIVLPMAEYDGYSPPNYIFPDRETAQRVVDLHNAHVKAQDAVNAWHREHRYLYGWEGQQG